MDCDLHTRRRFTSFACRNDVRSLGRSMSPIATKTGVAEVSPDEATRTDPSRGTREHVAQKRGEIGRDRDALQCVMSTRVHRLTDWRRQLRANLLVAVVVASVAGLLLGWFTSRVYG